MSQKSPFNHRPKLHLALTSLSGSPLNFVQNTPSSTPFLSPFAPPRTPFATTSYSPFRSAGLRPPTPYGGPVQFNPRRPKSSYGNYTWFRIKRLLGSKALWIVVALLSLMWWWSNGGREDLGAMKVKSSGLGRELLTSDITKDLQFFPASNPKIHYIGRWTATPNRLRKDGTFPGVYFDITIARTTTLFLSLHNSPEHSAKVLPSTLSTVPTATPTPNKGHLSFRPVSLRDKPAPPISLLARVDQEEYVLLHNSSALVAIRSGDLNPNVEHHVRIIAPMTDDYGIGVVELEGLWLSKGGKLLRVEGSLLAEEYEDEDALQAENEKIGEKHRLGLSGIMSDDGRRKSVEEIADDEEDDDTIANGDRKKVLEVITDNPGSLGGKNRGRRTGGADGLLAGVMGWEYLLGEMFGVDHVGLGVDGMCLTQDCIGGTGEPYGIGDVFFRSGPRGSTYFEHPWLFHTYIPDVIVLNLGGSDHASFETYSETYNKSSWDLSTRFEDTYVSLIKAIRQLAYPNHPSLSHSESSASPIPNTIPASIPIFVMRPLHGQLEHATQGVVARLRADGDKSVFWLDTSGWLDADLAVDENSNDNPSQDFFLDRSARPQPKWRLTEQGNQRVAIFLHLHTCRYLAGVQGRCAFLPPEVYQGRVFDPEEANFDRWVEDEKERKLKKLFWESGEEGEGGEVGA